MTAETMPRWACPCSLHPRKVHTDPCRLCVSKHPASRSGDHDTRRFGTPALPRGPRSEGPGLDSSVGRAPSEDGGRGFETRSGFGPSPDPALSTVNTAVREPGQPVRAGSPSQGRSVEQGSPRPSSAPALSGSRSTVAQGG